MGDVGDPDPYTATMDAVADFRPDEIIISTLPVASSGWLRRDLVERIDEATDDIPVTHVVVDVDAEGLPFKVTLVVANRTTRGNSLIDALKAKAEGPQHVFIVVVPQEGGDGVAAAAARGRLSQLRERARVAGLIIAGMVGDPDPYIATMNALQFFRIDDIVISTLPETRSGWAARRPHRARPALDQHPRRTSHRRARRRRRGGLANRMEAAAVPHGHEHHGPPPANRSSRVDPSQLGMYLFIISEIMVFGAFFTAYFFIRVVNGDQWFRSTDTSSPSPPPRSTRASWCPRRSRCTGRRCRSSAATAPA